MSTGPGLTSQGREKERLNFLARPAAATKCQTNFFAKCKELTGKESILKGERASQVEEGEQAVLVQPGKGQLDDSHACDKRVVRSFQPWGSESRRMEMQIMPKTMASRRMANSWARR